MSDVITYAQALTQFSRRQIRTKLARGVWQQAAHGVMVTHNGPITDEQLECIALLANRPGTALAGLSAARRFGLKGFEPEEIDLAIPEGSKPLDIPGTRTHYSTMLEPFIDIHPIENPRRTTLERAVVDAASWSTNRRFARVIVLATFQQRLTNVRRMREALARRGPCRHRALIVQSILDAVGGIQSLPERDFNRIWMTIGLPPPTRQRKLKGRDGHYYLDVYWEEFDLAVEIHGIPHSAVAQWDADLMRANEIHIAGPKLLIFSSYAVRNEQFAVADQLARMAMSRGWSGKLPKPEQFQPPQHFPSPRRSGDGS